MCRSEEDLRNTGSETCGLEALCLLIAFKSLRSWVFCWQAIMSLSRVQHIVIPASSKHLRVQLIVFTTCWCWQMLHVGITQYQKYTSHYWWGLDLKKVYEHSWKCQKPCRLLCEWSIIYNAGWIRISCCAALLWQDCGRRQRDGGRKIKKGLWMWQLTNRYEWKSYYITKRWQTKS